MGVTEGVAEGGVDDHEEHDAADGAERKLPSLQTLPEETATHLPRGERTSAHNSRDVTPFSLTRTGSHLTHDERHHDGHEELREDGGEGHGRRGAELEEEEEA